MDLKVGFIYVEIIAANPPTVANNTAAKLKIPNMSSFICASLSSLGLKVLQNNRKIKPDAAVSPNAAS